VFQGEDCTFTTAQSPWEFADRQVEPDPLNPAARAAGPTMTRSVALKAACAVMRSACQTELTPNAARDYRSRCRRRENPGFHQVEFLAG
jgi:hypothetical protein